MADLVLSLFPGADLFGHAFRLEGYPVVTGPDVVWGSDVRDFHPPAGRFDGVIGGPPCQPFSALVHLVRACGREPKHANLIPEFERIVSESRPRWFLMEEVDRAPVPAVDGYAVHSFILDNSWLPADDGLGESQMRRRRFSFGVLGETAVDLRRWIELAPLMAPKVEKAVVGDHDSGAGKLKRTLERSVLAREPAGLASDVDRKMPGGGRLGGHSKKRPWALCCELQGLPEDFLSESPFTVEGKYRLLGNGVPIPMGRALARAIRESGKGPENA